MTNILTVVWLHFVADFLLQSHYVSTHKSRDNYILLMHVAIYSVPLLWFGVRFALINATLHFATDWVTSRMTSRLWATQQWHWFFAVIGLDQAIHLTCLIVTLPK